MEIRSVPRPEPDRARLRAAPGSRWEERFEALFADLRKPARVMLRRAFGSAISDEEAEDIYASAWTSTLSALRGRTDEMDDGELRAYLLTAVANHGSKEMRRRSRRPTRPLEDTHSQVLSDVHQPTPEERVSGAESGSVARDVLASLPPRRRAVMLLRYGWGLSPAEICALVSGLSPRAYRKEVTRGVGEMIERLKQVESGEWCHSREPLLRDYVAGTAGEEIRRQATAHLGHCRSCSELVSRLNGQLNDLGSTVAWTSVAGSVGEQKVALADRAAGGVDRVREAGSRMLDRGESVATDAGAAIASSGGTRGVGAAGVGLAAKLTGLGAAGKAAVACLGAGAAATACVAAGVVPGVGPGSGDRDRGERPLGIEKVSDSAAKASKQLVHAPVTTEPERPPGAGGSGGSDGPGSHQQPEGPQKVESEPAVAPEGVPEASPAPTAPPVEQEFGVTAAATSTSGSSGGGSSKSGGSSSPSGQDIGREFGP